jgi:pectinesterase
MRLFALALALIAAFTAAHSQDIHVRVDPRGSGSAASTTDFTTIQQALDHAPQAAAPFRTILEIAPGIYHERIDVTRNRPRITLLGLGHSPEDVVITNSLNAKQAGGTFLTATADIEGDDFAADNITFENSAGNTGQAVAAAVRSDRALFKHCRFLGDQDTLFADFGRQYYVDSYIAGGVDFIFGNAAAVFSHDEIHIIRAGYLTAQSRTAPDQPTGYVIDHSRVTSPICAENAPECRASMTFFLGRPWRLYSRVIVMNTELPSTLNPEGWSVWNRKDPVTPNAFYAEFHNTGPGANISQRVAWSHQLTAHEAAAFTPANFLRGTDQQPRWDPLAEAAKLP